MKEIKQIIEFEIEGVPKRFKTQQEAKNFFRRQVFSRWFKRECRSIGGVGVPLASILKFLDIHKNAVMFYYAMEEKSGGENYDCVNQFAKEEREIYLEEF